MLSPRASQPQGAGATHPAPSSPPPCPLHFLHSPPISPSISSTPPLPPSSLAAPPPPPLTCMNRLGVLQWRSKGKTLQAQGVAPCSTALYTSPLRSARREGSAHKGGEEGAYNASQMAAGCSGGSGGRWRRSGLCDSLGRCRPRAGAGPPAHPTNCAPARHPTRTCLCRTVCHPTMPQQRAPRVPRNPAARTWRPFPAARAARPSRQTQWRCEAPPRPPSWPAGGRCRGQKSPQIRWR